MSFLIRLFTWWNQATLSTGLWTMLFGERVGEDENGNVYYRTRGGKIDPTLGFERRWVIYKGYCEASLVPTGWYGWLHHIVDTPPNKEDYAPKAWQLPRAENLTGRPGAYHPPGSTLASGQRPKAGGDYSAWSPEA